MALVPFGYNAKSLLVRGGGTALTLLSIAATVGVLAFMLCMQQGFARMVEERGREDLAVFLRPGATSEGESAFTRERGLIVQKEVPEIATAPDGTPLAGLEVFLALSLEKTTGGKTNVPIRGVQPVSYAIHGDDVRIVEGRKPAIGTDELIVSTTIMDRIANCHPGDVLVLNLTPFRIVGTFAARGSYASEIWGDLDRLQAALQREEFSRVLAVLKPGVQAKDLDARLKDDVRVPAKVQSEREYLAAQTGDLSGMLIFVGGFLAVVMGIGAVFTGTNAMLASIGSRTHEVGILLATGFRPTAIFVAFLFESALLGLVGGLIGCAVVLLVSLFGMEIATTNFTTFTQVVFGFRFTWQVLAAAVAFSLLLGVVGGTLPALRAARMTPTQALRRA